jgi:hypothetical protein
VSYSSAISLAASCVPTTCALRDLDTCSIGPVALSVRPPLRYRAGTNEISFAAMVSVVIFLVVLSVAATRRRLGRALHPCQTLFCFTPHWGSGK